MEDCLAIWLEHLPAEAAVVAQAGNFQATRAPEDSLAHFLGFLLQICVHGLLDRGHQPHGPDRSQAVREKDAEESRNRLLSQRSPEPNRAHDAGVLQKADAR